MADIPHVAVGQIVKAADQNALIDRVNENTAAIENLSVPGGDLEAVEELIEEAVDNHVNDSEPHPAYDDMPTLRLIFENGLI